MTKEPETITIAQIHEKTMALLGGKSMTELYDYVCNLERRYLIGQINSQKPEEEKP